MPKNYVGISLLGTVVVQYQLTVLFSIRLKALLQRLRAITFLFFVECRI